MDILPCSSIPLDCLKNALLINENNAGFRIKSFSFDLKTTEIMVNLIGDEDPEYLVFISFSSLSNWSIQL